MRNDPLAGAAGTLAAVGRASAAGARGGRYALPKDAPLEAAAARVAIVVLLAALACAPAAAQQRRNWFGDPFAQATSGLPGCPVPEGPLTSEDEMRRESHARIERGTTCWLQKKCDEPNAYKSDPQINAAAVAAIAGDARFAATSLWVTTQRKFVFLQGCVRSRAQIGQLVGLVRRVPGVEYVGDELLVGTRGKPPYRVAERQPGLSAPAAR